MTQSEGRGSLLFHVAGLGEQQVCEPRSFLPRISLCLLRKRAARHDGGEPLLNSEGDINVSVEPGCSDLIVALGGFRPIEREN